MTQPLAGIRVIDASTVIAAPLTAALLGEFGAEVIKVEMPGTGDSTRRSAPYYNGQSLPWRITNRNKKGITLDFHKLEAADLFARLVAASDVVVTNFRPKKLVEWRIDYPDLCRAKPDIIMFHLTAFGRSGPYADLPGFARIAEAFSGLTYITGYPDRPPVFAGYPIADGVSGMYGAFAIMLALQHRANTGEGQLIDLALYEPMLRMMEDFIVGYGVVGWVKERQGNTQPNVAPNNIYPTADGRHVILPVSTEQMWRRLVELLQAPELLPYDTNQKRLQHREAIDERITAFTGQYALEDLLHLLREHQIACGKVYAVGDIFADPQIRERGNLMEIYDEELQTTLTMQSPIPHFSTITGTVTRSAPGVGEHNTEIYGQLLGLDEQTLAAYRRAGVI